MSRRDDSRSFRGVLARWLDPSQSLAPMVRNSISGLGWAHAAATLALWMALPLAIGWWRVLRRDVG